MTTPHTIPLLRFAGSYREVGAQIGDACMDTIQRESAFDGQAIPAGRSRDEQLSLADRYADVTRGAMPWVFEELEGCAEAAGVDPRALFACCIEEIWYEPRSKGLGVAVMGRCSDMVAVPPATADGHVLTAHNNDMGEQYMRDLVAIERTCGDDPPIFTVGNGIWISVGWNAEGMNLTGNELSPNDERVGIPREIQVRAMLRERTLPGMVEIALHPDRASSYNNVLVDRAGEVANVEGSATEAAVTGVDERGHLVHTNHYVCEPMLGFEGDPDYAARSRRRYDRARELLGAAEPGSVTVELLRGFLSDHENAPDSLCRHATEEHGSVTCFWSIADVTTGRITFGHGNPCDSVEQEFTFASASASAGV